ncbi:MAG: cytochrome C oxidase subunit IV family protein [Pirellulales bacterium]|nr:cytochrome C oxidase subunit IV family protein [Pirellulales bacterium]
MDHTKTPSAPNSASQADVPLAHVVELRILLTVFAALIMLTAITVAVSYFDFGAFNLSVALGVATIKATLVALYFMHLRYDNAFYATIFVIAVGFLGLFLGITMLDAVEYYPDVQTWQQSTR